MSGSNSPAAMIFGTDAVAEPAEVDLPTSTEGWFLEGGNGLNGTQVPDYWVNKVGGEISAAIAALGAVLNMGVRNQIGNFFTQVYNSLVTQSLQIAGLQNSVATLQGQVATLQTGLAAALAEIPQDRAPVTVAQVGIPLTPSYSGSISTSQFTAPTDGFILAHASVNLNAPLPNGAGIQVTLSNSLNGVISGDETQLSQSHVISIQIEKGQTVSFTLGVVGQGSYSSPSFNFTSRIDFFFDSTPLQ